MKPKYRTTSPLAALIACSFAAAASSTFAATYDWKTAGDGSWNTTTNWSPTGKPVTSDTVNFNATGQNGDQTIYLGGNQAALVLNFANTGTTTLLGGISGTPANNTLSTGVGSITVNAGAGAVTIGDTVASPTAKVDLVMRTFTFANNSSNLLTIANGLSSPDSAGTTTFTVAGTGNTTFGGAIVGGSGANTTNIVVTSSGNTTFGGAIGNGTGSIGTSVIVGSTGVTTLGVANTFTGNLALGVNLGTTGVVRLTHADAIKYAGKISALNANTLMGLDYATGGTMNYNDSAPSLDLSEVTSSGYMLNITLDGNNQSFSSANLGGRSQIRVSNSATTGTPVLSVSDVTTVGRVNAAGTGTFSPVGSASISLNTVTTSAVSSDGPRTQLLVLAGNSTGDNKITGTMTESSSGGATGSLLALEKTGPSTWALSGASNSFTGATSISGGTLVLDYAVNSNTKLADGAALSLLGGTLQLKGGDHTEIVGSTTINTGGSFVTQNTGTSKLQMGAITFSGGAVDFGADNIATTTNAVANGILSQRATVGGTNFAMKSSATITDGIVAYDYTTNGSTGYTGGAMVANTNYALTANGASTLASTTGAGTNTLKIANTATGSLAVDAKTLTTGAILFTGSADYGITTSGVGKINNTLLHNYGTGNLTLGALGVGLTQYGTGKTILSAAATTDSALAVNGGTVQFSDNLQIGTNGSAKAITLNNGTLIADTTNGSIALNNAGTNSRTFTIGLGGGTLDVIGGNNLTVSGVISATVPPGITEPYVGQITYGSGSSDGKIILSGANTYKGATILAGGVTQANVADVVDISGAFGGFGGTAASHGSLISFTGGTLQYSSLSAGTDYSNRFKNSTEAIKLDTNGQNVTYASPVDFSNTAGLTLNDTAATKGTLTLNAASTYTGDTSVTAGSLQINNTTGSGTGSGSVSVSANATLGGAGTIAGGVNVSTLGSISAGAGEGVGNLTLQSGLALGGVYQWQLGALSTASAGVHYDTLTITAGDVNLTGASLGLSLGDFGPTVDEFWQSNRTWSGILNNTGYGTLTGNFAAIDNSTWSSLGTFSTTYTNNDVNLVWSAIPEPDTAFLVAGLGMVALLRRRRL